MKLFWKFYCKLCGKHAWRRQHKFEWSSSPGNIKYCKRCGAAKAIVHRAKKEA